MFMPRPLFSLAVEPDRRQVSVVPEGELDLASAGRLDREVTELVAAGFDHVVVDLRGLTFIDSSGLRALLVLRNGAERAGRTLTLVPGCPEVQRVFALTLTYGLFDWRLH